MPALDSLKAELADPKKRNIVIAGAGGIVLLGLRARKKAASGSGATGSTSGAAATSGTPARLVPLGATSGSIPDGYNGSGTDATQTAVNALAGTTQSLQDLVSSLRDSGLAGGSSTPAGVTSTPSTPAPVTPQVVASTPSPQSNQLAPWQTLAQGFYAVADPTTGRVDNFSVIPGQGVHNENAAEVAAHPQRTTVTDQTVGASLRQFLGR